jgi:hypothetical protein
VASSLTECMNCNGPNHVVLVQVFQCWC